MNKIIIGVLVLVVIGGGAWYFVGHKGSDAVETGGAVTANQPEVKYTDPKSGEVAVVGAWSCLPLVSGAEATKDNCVLGVKGDDGKFYALNTAKVEIVGKDATTATKVRVVGTLANNSESDLTGVYNYDAVLAVRVLQNAE